MKVHKIVNLLKQAEIISENSKDSETKVGGILVDPNTMTQLTTGYNSFVRDTKDNNLPKTRPEKYEFMIHCETNIICNAAKNGIKTAGNIIVQTLSPCHACTRLLYQAGINTVFFKELYRIYDSTKDRIDLKDLKLDYYKVNGYNFYKMIIGVL